MITDDPQLRRALLAMRRRYAEEFDTGGGDAVSACFERAVDAVVPGARIADLVPVLVDRHTRACMDATG